jgi:NAD dependent epimerase/dehydratase family
MAADGEALARPTPPILLTGASGEVGSRLRGPLSELGPLRLVDIVPPAAGAAETLVVGDLADPDIAERAVSGVAAIVHLAAYPRPDASWEVLAEANVRTTAAVLDAAARHGVRRIVFASSVHAAGGYGDPADWPVDPRWPARPCCRYGVSKATSELLLQVHADQHASVAAVALRFGLVAPKPRWRQEIRGWTPVADLGPLVAGALRVPPGYQVHFAVAATERPRYRTDGAREALDYRSQAEAYLGGDSLSDHPPEYFPDCALWRHQLETGHEGVRSNH